MISALFLNILMVLKVLENYLAEVAGESLDRRLVMALWMALWPTFTPDNGLKFKLK